MDVDAMVNIIGKAMIAVRDHYCLRLGGGLTEVILMQAVGGASILLAGIIAAKRLDIKVSRTRNEVASRTASARSAACDLFACDRLAAFYRDRDAFRAGRCGSRRVVRRVH